MISVIIPARQESETISQIVYAAKPFCDEIIVVLSEWDTSTLAKVPSFARIVYENRQGKGYALRAGAESAYGTLLVFIDADLSHNPSDIPRLVAPIIAGDSKHVVASRMLGGSSELFYDIAQFIRLCGSHLITLCINHKFNIKLTDSQNGFRAISKELFQKLNVKETHTTIEQELTVKTLDNGEIIIEVGAHEYARFAGKSKIVVFRHGWRYIFYLLKVIFKKKRSVSFQQYSVLQKKYNKYWFET